VSFRDEFLEQGWLKAAGIFQPSFIDEVRDEFERQYEELIVSGQGKPGYRTLGDQRMQLSPQLKGPMLDPRLWANPLLMTILKQLLGEDFLIDSIACIVSLPGAENQEPHRDHGKLFKEEPDLNCNLLPFGIIVGIPLVDLTPEKGTMNIFPGIRRDPKANRSELPAVSRGDCYLVDYRTKHQGTANRSNEWRPVIYIVYSRPWFIDTVNFRRQAKINIAAEDFAALSPAHQRMFRRLACKGGFDRTEAELLSGGVAGATEPASLRA
jgi:hypothetical protein